MIMYATRTAGSVFVFSGAACSVRYPPVAPSCGFTALLDPSPSPIRSAGPVSRSTPPDAPGPLLFPL